MSLEKDGTEIDLVCLAVQSRTEISSLHTKTDTTHAAITDLEIEQVRFTFEKESMIQIVSDLEQETGTKRYKLT